MDQHAGLNPPPSRFMADAMLGRLARWLRILGYDTAYEKTIADDRLIEQAVREDRWLLTRDGYLTQLKALRGRHTLLTGDNLDDQLRQLHDELSLPLELNAGRPFRCAGCNSLLHRITEQEAAALVPPFVAGHYHEFLQCRHCGRVYWPGTHWEAIIGRLALLRTRKTKADR